MIGSRWWTFAEITPSARRPIVLHRLVMSGLAAADRAGIESVYGYCDATYPRAQAWIERMGFRPVQDNERDRELRLVEAFVQSPAWIRGK
jgi:N-acetylglutamate synthase-like GNAT family acetyltransferase